MKDVKVAEYTIGKGHPLAFISGPCVIENEKHTLQAAETLLEIFAPYSCFSFIFKASFDKANRSSIESFRGPGIEKGLKILQKVKDTFHIPVITDIHLPQQAQVAADVCDMLQIPAFLCRQTDLLLAAGKTKKPINIKKGQFLSPWEIQHAVQKIEHTDNHNILLTDRGTFFGYNNLVSDMRAIPIMQEIGYPVCFDASHSIQLPGGLKNTTGGTRQYIPILAKAAIAAGCNALFIESHPEPHLAKSDAASVMHFNDLKILLPQLEKIYFATREN